MSYEEREQDGKKTGALPSMVIEHCWLRETDRFPLSGHHRHCLSPRAATFAHIHPPAAGGQPLPLLEQHQAFLATDQPACQFAKPATQSYGSAMGAAVGAPVTQPPP